VIEKYKLFEEFKVIETNEPVVNEIIELKPIENKEMEITLRHDDFLETSSEVKFTSMALEKFPIKYRNFSKELEPLKSNFLGMTDVDFGFMKLEGVLVKVLDFLDFKLIEFRKKDFRIAIDEKDSLFEYEIYKDVKNKRLEEIFDEDSDLGTFANWLRSLSKNPLLLAGIILTLSVFISGIVLATVQVFKKKD